MKQPQDLTCDQMLSLVRSIQDHLYLDHDPQGGTFWNPDKPWGGDEFEFIAEALAKYNLVPREGELVENQPPPKRYVLYDFDRGELAGSRIFADPELAGDYASELSDVIVVPILLPEQIVAQAIDELQPCDCQLSGDFCCGVPGILAKVQNCRVVLGAKIERCDQCQRYASDQAAHDKLVELGMA